MISQLFRHIFVLALTLSYLVVSEPSGDGNKIEVTNSSSSIDTVVDSFSEILVEDTTDDYYEDYYDEEGSDDFSDEKMDNAEPMKNSSDADTKTTALLYDYNLNNRINQKPFF